MKLSVKSSDQWLDITLLLLTLCDEYCHLSVGETEAEQYEVLQRERERETMITNVPCHCYAVTSVLKLKHGNKKII